MFFKVIILAVTLQCIAAADTRLGASKGYKLEYFFKADWFMANLFCRYHGLQLASVETAEQQAYIEKLIVDQGYGSEFFWISGSDLRKEGEWSWYSTGNKFQYTNWASSQPTNSLQVEHCLNIWNSQKWNDAECVNQFYFICEIPL